tara:strand:- start:104 stop:553 length:450 start_codon:yes stop_codon:yes gene_type:complete
MTIKELKADKLLLQAKLDDALAEIQELKNLVEIMEKEKEKNNGLGIVAEPYETGLFRIDQMNIKYLHIGAVEWLKKEKDIVYQTDHRFQCEKCAGYDCDLIRIAHELAARMESLESDVHEMVQDAIGEVVELYLDRLNPNRHEESDDSD